MDRDKAVLLWKVRCINTETKELFDRHLFLDVTELPEQERKHVEAVITAGKTTDEFVAYRQLFEEITVDEIEERTEEVDSFQMLIAPGYFEDQYGDGMGDIGLGQVLTGTDYPIIAGNPQSVLRLGPSEIRDKEEWSKNTTEEIAHFLRLSHQLQESSWIKGPVKLRSTECEDSAECIVPDTEDTSAIIPCFRQLYASGDVVFNRAMNKYLRHVANDAKKDWVQAEKRQFNKFLNAQARWFDLEAQQAELPRTYTNKQFIEMVIYGSRALHFQSDKNWEIDLKEVTDIAGAEIVAFAFNASVRLACKYVLCCSAVVEQDFFHWITNKKCVGPDDVSLQDIFG